MIKNGSFYRANPGIATLVGLLSPSHKREYFRVDEVLYTGHDIAKVTGNV